YPPQYGLASALSWIFLALTVAALYLQRRYLARRSYVTLGGKGSRPRLVDLGTARWAVLAFCVAVFIVAVAAPYLTLLAVSISRSWGLQFWQNLTLQHYRFVLLGYDVTRRAIVNSLILASGTATLAVLIGLFAGWLLVFVPALQELSASVLLFSSGSITLAVAVYNLYETGALGPVAALAIVTMLIITGAIVLATRLGR